MGYPMSQTPGAQRQRTWRRGRGATIAINGLGRLVDQPDLTRPERPCACCRKVFQPSVQRRLLCAVCYRRPSSVVENATRGSS
jgi:hypothetical protein